MTHFIEDVIEILIGAVPRSLNFRIDYKDRAILKSINRQITDKIGLTDRQLAMVISKIEKYRDGLIKNGVNIVDILKNPETKLPVRVIDRKNSITIEKHPLNNNYSLVINHEKTKDFDEIWHDIEKRISAKRTQTFKKKTVELTDRNFLEVVEPLSALNFDYDESVSTILKKIQEIRKKSENFRSTAKLVNGVIDIVGYNQVLKNKFQNTLDAEDDTNLLKKFNQAKNCGFFPVNHQDCSLNEISELSKKIIFSDTTKFQINTENNSVSDLLESISELEQWPLLVIVDQNDTVLEEVSQITEDLKKYVQDDEITVFFRLENSHKKFRHFSDFVKNNKLNNYIDQKTKVVVISKNKVSKPLIRSGWKPQSAIILANHGYGIISSYVNDIISVYYYNQSLLVSREKIAGKKIDQL